MAINRRLEQELIDLYATTLVEGLSQEGGIDSVIEGRDQLNQIIEYLYSHLELIEYFDTLVSLSEEERTEKLSEVFEGLHPTVFSVINIMVERGEFKKLPKVNNLFHQKIVTMLNTNIIDVVTRVPLDDHLREVIKKKAAAELGTDIILDETIDENMLGGIIMNVNGKRIDASMRTMLGNARRVLKV